MSRRLYMLCVVGLALMTGSVFAADTYELDPTHAAIEFKVAHLVISKVSGNFNSFTAALQVDDDGRLESAESIIQVSSIDSGVERRDNHLRAADFFDAETYPEISFKSTSVEKKDGKDVLIGDLTIRGITKKVEFPFTLLGPIQDPWGNTKVGFEAETTINRTDFGLTWNSTLETGGVVVGEDVEISINLEANKQ